MKSAANVVNATKPVQSDMIGNLLIKISNTP